MAVGKGFVSVKKPLGLNRKDARAFRKDARASRGGKPKTSKKEMDKEWLAYLHSLGEATLVKAQENAPEGTGKLKKSVRLELHNNAKKPFTLTYEAEHAATLHEGAKRFPSEVMHKAHVADTRKHKRRTASGKIVDVRRHKKTYKLGFKPVQTRSEPWYALDTSKIEANPWVQEAWEEVLGDKSLVPRTLRKKLPKKLTLML